MHQRHFSVLFGAHPACRLVFVRACQLGPLLLVSRLGGFQRVSSLAQFSNEPTEVGRSGLRGLLFVNRHGKDGSQSRWWEYEAPWPRS